MRKYHQEDVRNKGWYTSPPSLRPPDFTDKDVFDLILNGSELVARLVACGFTESSAWDIIDNANANSRAILDFLTQDKIATLTAENQSLKFQASQAAQNAFITANQEAQTAELIRRINPMPVPAYQVPNPYAGCGCNPCGCGC